MIVGCSLGPTTHQLAADHCRTCYLGGTHQRDLQLGKRVPQTRGNVHRQGPSWRGRDGQARIGVSFSFLSASFCVFLLGYGPESRLILSNADLVMSLAVCSALQLTPDPKKKSRARKPFKPLSRANKPKTSSTLTRSTNPLPPLPTCSPRRLLPPPHGQPSHPSPRAPTRWMSSWTCSGEVRWTHNPRPRVCPCRLTKCLARLRPARAAQVVGSV